MLHYDIAKNGLSTELFDILVKNLRVAEDGEETLTITENLGSSDLRAWNQHFLSRQFDFEAVDGDTERKAL